MDTKSKVDYRLILQRSLAFLLALIGLVLLLQSVLNFKDVQYFALETIPERFAGFIYKNGAKYMKNWVYSGKEGDKLWNFSSNDVTPKKLDEKVRLFKDSNEKYVGKTFTGEASDFYSMLVVLYERMETDENYSPNAKEVASINRYTNKGYRFYFYCNDNLALKKELKKNTLFFSLKDVLKGNGAEEVLVKEYDENEKPILPRHQVFSTADYDNLEKLMKNSESDIPKIQNINLDERIYITISKHYYADYVLGFWMIIFAATGFLFAMTGVVMLERLAGRRIIESKTRIVYFKKGLTEIILAVFLVSSFNIVAIVFYVWGESKLADFFETSHANLLAHSGAVLYGMLTALTITIVGAGLNAAENNAKLLKKMKAELIANVSHDIKTPLTSIIGYVDLLSQEENLTNEAKDYIEVLRSKSERLKNIISDLVELSQSTGGNGSLVIEKLDFSELIKQALAEMDDTIIESGFEVKKSLPEEPVLICADGKKLYRVFQNILDNAFKYALSFTPISVVLNITPKKASLEVQNTASYDMKFTEEEVLERFVRGDSARTDEGSGLGLSIAETFTKECGGDFKVKIDGDQFKVIVEFKRQ